MNNIGTISMGLRCPIIREGDNMKDVALQAIKNVIDSGDLKPGNRDIVAITEAVVSRSQRNYVTIDQIVKDIASKITNKKIALYKPIMSRNRFSLILRAFARFADEIVIYVDSKCDDQGNPTFGINKFTGVDIQEYYKQICNEENCKVEILADDPYDGTDDNYFNICEKNYEIIDARCQPNKSSLTCYEDNVEYSVKYDLTDFCNVENNEHGWSQYGLLGSNKANEETLKLFPRNCNELCNDLKQTLDNLYGGNYEVIVYGDGCFKDPVCGIWEFADPVTCPGYTKGLEGTPNELKIKYLADNEFSKLNGQELVDAIKNRIKTKDSNLVGQMASEGTTPRRYIDLLASLADLTSGSGDKGTPVIYIKNYFENYSC